MVKKSRTEPTWRRISVEPIDRAERWPLLMRLWDSSAERYNFLPNEFFALGLEEITVGGKHFWGAKQSENGLFWASLKTSRRGLSGRVKLPEVTLFQPTKLMRR